MTVVMHARGMASAAILFGSIGTASLAQDDPDATLTSAEAAGGMEQLVEQAQQEGELLVYGAPSADKMNVWFQGFQEEYGIPVQYFRAPSNQVYQRFSQEQAAGRAMSDALIISVLELVEDADSKGYIAEYTPQTADMFPADAIVPGKAWPAYTTVQSVAWNTEVVPEDLQEALRTEPLEAMLDPRLKDRIAVVSVTAGGPQLAGVANLVRNRADEYGWEYLEKLAEQNPAVSESSTGLLPMIIAGDYWATPDASDSIFAPAVEEGAPVAFSFPETTAATVFYMSVSANAAHPHAARLLMEWMTSPEAQAELAEIAQAQVTIEGWEDSRAIAQQPWYSPPENVWFGAASDPELRGEGRDQLYQRWQEILGR